MKLKSNIKLNDDNKVVLNALMQEAYIDAVGLRNDAQKILNMLNSGTKPETVDELAKITREKSNLLKIKESSTKLKLEISKLQLEVLKLDNQEPKAREIASEEGKIDLEDFNNIRAELKKNNF